MAFPSRRRDRPAESPDLQAILAQLDITTSALRDALRGSIETQTDFNHGQTTVGTTAVQITETSTPAVKGVLVKAHGANTGTVYAGKTEVTTGTGFELLAGEAVGIEVDNANKVYVIASVADQKVSWVTV